MIIKLLPCGAHHTPHLGKCSTRFQEFIDCMNKITISTSDSTMKYLLSNGSLNHSIMMIDLDNTNDHNIDAYFKSIIKFNNLSTDFINKLNYILITSNDYVLNFDRLKLCYKYLSNNYVVIINKIDSYDYILHQLKPIYEHITINGDILYKIVNGNDNVVAFYISK